MVFLLHTLALIFGILLLKRAYHIYQSGKESLTWKPTIAYIISTDLGKMKNYGFIGHLVFQTYLAIIKYNYTVDEIEYISESYSPEGDRKFENYFGIPGPARAVEFLKQYPDNAKITVYYSSEHHEEAVIKPGVRLVAFLPQMMIGVGLILACFIF
ncbi:MAG: hypothetical protein HN963_05380 [Thiotrichales bacterium]|jgi:hypothetical protein|nr:hypothetical protein [Deltaproteobacteria bacterium]MBT7006346.1 hypothetical protein [Thiotrichales bacterium]